MGAVAVNHWRVTWMVSSNPFGVLTPSWRGSRTPRVRSVMRSTATLLVRGRMVSPMAIGRNDPLGLSKGHHECTAYVRADQLGSSPWRRRLTTSDRLSSRSADAGRIKLRMCEGLRPTALPLMWRGTSGEPCGSDRSTSTVGAALAATWRKEFMFTRSSMGSQVGEGGARKPRRLWGGPVGLVRGAAQARRRALSWIKSGNVGHK